MSTTNTDELLDQRGKTHGDFQDHARYTQAIKSTVALAEFERLSRGQTPLEEYQLESLQMIAHKVGRILAGDANELDHWDDIAGYARLVSRTLSKNAATATPGRSPKGL